METNIELLIYTVLGVGVFIEILKKNSLDTNILATVATILGAVIYTLLSDIAVANIIIGAVVGAASSGFYDLGKGLTSIFNIKSVLSQLGESELPPKLDE